MHCVEQQKSSSQAYESDAGVEIRVPKLPESVTDATLVAWHKKPGERVQRDENLVDIETDKVVFEVPAPQAGVLEEVHKQNGETVISDEVIAVIAPREGAPAPVEGVPPPVSEAREREEEPPGEAALSPAVRRLVEEHGLDARRIPASGKGGRLTKADVLRHLEQQRQPAPPEAPPPGGEPATAAEPAAGPAAVAEIGVRRVPMSRLRQRIAERMVEAQRTAAILTTFNEINMHAVLDMRRRYRDAFEQRYGIKLGLMSFFVKASIEALKRYPIINSSVEGSDVLYHDYYDIGIAVSTERGLVVPVLRNADRLGFAEIEAGIVDFARRARDGDLTIEELSGGTFTITNGGVFGSLLSTPILNPPQSAILGMHKIEDRAVAENGEAAVRPMMYVALSYDHRIIDGREAVQYLIAIKELLEDPARLFLEI
ncbi:MAG: 2-oxoglutarate dehydrogenase complex dihydrolipoyllysine-residue succinyltransferase [Gammaproteobacteria bacterium]|nr:2-oxoglutarate dehydrogenase complex dihydrolipoyllysine-residue succinyltransferase [Gammaproteobacteria bacterium]NIR97097.1 2-oxoglutarate dehydrogenase complex dihydrolipoyllysine-residue succinyltransferase [Gammaproteobacteria bacterium]NIT62800.1 2-oxoglutarate dehydrogenase complex dihydrolipoyllysine-residue succinyltransferase [Gammaproteobacteria bacterium]NIV19765.1 2-oxoglutarate dehydrogenase complex dihydrolipoyllysine-residue succinyltransferase [Gammaproteobacteria bacterium]